MFEEGVTHIGDYAFDAYRVYGDNTSEVLLKATLPSTLKSIGNSAFSGNHLLTINGLPQEMQKTGQYAFADIAGMTDPTLPEVIEEGIGTGAFEDIAQSLRVYPYSEGLNYVLRESIVHTLIPYDTLTLPDKLRIVGDEAFVETAAQMVVVPSHCQQLGHRVFENSAIRVVVLPDEIDIETDALSGTPIRAVVCGENSKAWRWAIQQGIPVFAR